MLFSIEIIRRRYGFTIEPKPNTAKNPSNTLANINQMSPTNNNRPMHCPMHQPVGNYNKCLLFDELTCQQHYITIKVVTRTRSP